MLTKKEIIIAITALTLGALFFGELKFFGNETNESEKNFLALLDPWTSADLIPGATATNPTPATPTDTTSPTLVITSPTDNTQISTDKITVQLKASDNSGWVELVVQNLDAKGKARQTYTAQDQQVSNFVLYPGLNTILALARDKAGNVSTDFVLVERSGATTPTPAQPIPRPATPIAESTAEQRGRYRDGVYEGTGYYVLGDNKYPLTVQLTVQQGYIRRLIYLAFPKSDLVTSESFLDSMRDQLLETQDPSRVNTISGATGTSDAFLNATREALKQAK